MTKKQEHSNKASTKITDEMVQKINTFEQLNSEIKKLEKISKPMNEEIKNYFKENNITNADTDTCTAKLSIVASENYIEPLLIQKLKELGKGDLIELKETVNFRGLERELYEGHINENDLAGCKNVNYTYRLTVKARG